VVTADSLYRDDLAVAQRPQGGRQRFARVTDVSLVILLKRQLRPALRTSDGFRMEASIRRVLILAFTLGAQAKPVHTRVRSVIGQRFNQRIPGAALCAVDKWVVKATITRIM
jgi:hypothetical protein